ncbi:MAG: hypothetical protein A2469_04010 [Candidatus Magasanikbacteria bacterium RIFOXYC2_FULL_40_16]|uniref:Polymerase nucleotidyl transferase domain-containing protein n=1 Tax=Candidatus Magasanikbacteria bacterium RIFOXYC2_FULL_40_16 TaxID=1798703 RepID=A0A1F6P248_9BACT|nr:MAG: hypothetical protein A2301_03980 [Candidatus Magasanikbacteria bacterium RIFOXYB2_FULL_40_13]OGH90160.1 MAG: hypothetical protein A2469_04010 [Candidatus Magasanikbacteria bacterium RIFOXYC2_FULL_40_16]
MKKTKQALDWIVKIIRKEKIPFQICGGFAANIYGSTRPLADIDICVPNEKVFVIQKNVGKHIIYGPKRYKDKEFDLLLMTLKYKGQEIDICGADSMKLFNKKTKKWAPDKTNFNKSVKKKVHGLFIPVIPIKELIAYKQKISRRVDIQDVKSLLKKAL